MSDEPRQGRNLVLCFDGTGNQFGTNNTNVVRLVQSLDRDPKQQRLYYDPGVGTLPEPRFFTWLGRKISEYWGYIFGSGLKANVEQAYIYLMNTWEPGDRIFLFGFSRGAYTARVLAGMLHAVGLLPRGNENLVPYATELYRAIRTKSEETGRHWKLLDEFRATFSRPMHSGDRSRSFPTHFLGVWDTVSSVGCVWHPITFPFTASNPSLQHARHAMAIDERRWFFRQNRILPKEGQDVKELWFVGSHADVGGGYPGDLWQNAFRWMLAEATELGLLLDSERLKEVLIRTTQDTVREPWLDKSNESLKGWWWITEVIPKFVYDPETKTRSLAVGLGKSRFVKSGSLIHSSLLHRIREMSYTPRNLSPKFLESVRQLPEVPNFLPYL